MSTLPQAEHEVRALPMADVLPDPVVCNHRRTFDTEDLAGLAASLRAQGQLVPVVCRPAGDGSGQWWLVAGERRWRALGVLNAPTVLALVRDLSDAEAAQVQALENLARADVRPCEEGRALQQVIETEEAGGALASEAFAAAVAGSGRTSATVRNKLALLTLPEEVRDLVDDRSVSEGAAQALATLMPEHEAEARGWARATAAGRLTVEEVRELVQKFLGDEAQEGFSFADQTQDTEEVREVRAGAVVAADLFGRGAGVLFDAEAQAFRLDLQALRADELDTLAAKFRGVSGVVGRVIAEVQRAQGEEPAEAVTAEVNRAPEGVLTEVRGSWLWVTGARREGSLWWALYRAGAVWCERREAYYAPDAARQAQVREVLASYADQQGEDLQAAG